MRQVGNDKIAEAIHKILGGNAALKVKVHSISSLPNDKCEVTIYITEQSAVTGQTRRVLASELARFLLQQNYATQLKQQLAVESCQPRAAWTPEQVSNLLSNPPAGESSFSPDMKNYINLFSCQLWNELGTHACVISLFTLTVFIMCIN